MTSMRSWPLAAVLVTTIAGPTSAAEPEPLLVAAYVRQLAEQCGPLPQGATAPNMAERIDLNSDGKAEWVIDAARYPCARKSPMASEVGEQLTVFAEQQGSVVPVFQRSTFGVRTQRTGPGAPYLVMTLGGADCGGADRSERCDRRLVWRAADERFQLENHVATPSRPPAVGARIR